MADMVGITGAASVAPNGGDFKEQAVNINSGFGAVTPSSDNGINTSIPADLTGNGFNLPGAAQQHLIDINAVGLANPGGTSFGQFMPDALGGKPAANAGLLSSDHRPADMDGI